MLSRYVTNPTGRVFVLKNLPESVKAALFARYSRSRKGLRELLMSEFRDALGDCELPYSEKAKDFFRRVLAEYGDDSVAELAYFHVGIEGASMLAVKELENSRIGLSYLEKSSRYVSFSDFYKGEEVAVEPYLTYIEALFAFYKDAYKALREHLLSTLTPPEGIAEEAWKRAVRAKAFDIARHALPLSTLTNVGIAGNARAFEYLIVKAYASPYPEVRQLGEEVRAELSKVAPEFLERVKGPKGEAFVEFLKGLRALPIEAEGTLPEEGVKLLSIQGSWEEVLKLLAFERTGYALESIRPRSGMKEVWQAIERLRKNRRHKPPRAFEAISFTFQITSDIGVWRDLHRHRVLTHIRGPLSPALGYITPKEMEKVGLGKEYRELMERAKGVFEALERKGKGLGAYALPMAYRVSYILILNLREAFHLVELRSSPQGHPNYRRIAITMGKAIEEALNMKLFTFMDEGEYDLERLKAEQRTIEKLRRMGDLKNP